MKAQVCILLLTFILSSANAQKGDSIRSGDKFGTAIRIEPPAAYSDAAITTRDDEPTSRIQQTISPRKSFSIIQEFEKVCWKCTLQFTGNKHPPVMIGDPCDWQWQPSFTISPDDQWILQQQKTGSGSNTGILYHLDENGRLWRMEQDLVGIAFHQLEKSSGVKESDYYHTGIRFISWDLKSGLLRFQLHGENMVGSGSRIEHKLAYDLKRHVVVDMH